MQNVIYVLKFDFGRVWAPYDNAIAISIWLHFLWGVHFVKFLLFFRNIDLSTQNYSNFQKINFRIPEKNFSKNQFPKALFFQNFNFQIFENFKFSWKRIALRVPPAETRLTVYRQLETFERGDAGTLRHAQAQTSGIVSSFIKPQSPRRKFWGTNTTKGTDLRKLEEWLPGRFRAKTRFPMESNDS